MYSLSSHTFHTFSVKGNRGLVIHTFPEVDDAAFRPILLLLEGSRFFFFPFYHQGFAGAFYLLVVLLECVFGVSKLQPGLPST